MSGMIELVWQLFMGRQRSGIRLSAFFTIRFRRNEPEEGGFFDEHEKSGI